MIQWLDWLIIEFNMICWDLVPFNPNGVKPHKGGPQEAEGLSRGSAMDSTKSSEGLDSGSIPLRGTKC